MRLSFPHPLMKWDRGVCEEPTLVWWKNQVKPKNKTNFDFNRVCEEQIVSFSVFNTYMETSRNLANTHHAAHVEQFAYSIHEQPQITKANSTPNYRGVMEESGVSPAQQQPGQFRLPGVTANTPASTAFRLPGVTGNTTAPTTTNNPVNNNGAALGSVSVGVMGKQGTFISPKQAMSSLSTRKLRYASQSSTDRCDSPRQTYHRSTVHRTHAQELLPPPRRV